MQGGQLTKVWNLFVCVSRGAAAAGTPPTLLVFVVFGFVPRALAQELHNVTMRKMNQINTGPTRNKTSQRLTNVA